MKRITQSFAGVLLGAMLAASGAASAQQAPDSVKTSADVQLLEEPYGVFPAEVHQPNARIVRPGALLFASFDKNYDGAVSQAELEAGAAGAFTAADRDGDGLLRGFELSDWARAVGGEDGLLTNPMQFDADLDREITRTEFVEGMKRLAATVVDPETDLIHFSDLVTKPSARPAKGEPPTQE